MVNKIEHLKMIQGIITRMASNSFALKGWTVTLLVGIFALLGKGNGPLWLLIGCIPVLFFWGLDSYYLRLERDYRALYKKVTALTEEQITFDMKLEKKCKLSGLVDWWESFRSGTEAWFYLPLLIVTAASTMILTR